MTKVTVKDGEFHFSSPLAKHRFMELAEGKEVGLSIQEKMTPEMRKYFEGCLVPAFFYLHPGSGWQSFADAREVLKLEFSPGVRTVVGTDGKKVKVAPSTATLSRERFTQFVEQVTNWMIEQGVESDVLNSEEYLRWRDTNDDDDIYPPLARLKASYDSSGLFGSS